LLYDTEDISNSIDDQDYPILVHNTRLVQKPNILKYLKKVIVDGLYTPENPFIQKALIK